MPINTMSVMAQMEKNFMVGFLEFFKQAPKRSWNLYQQSESNPNGIPWSQANQQSDSALAYFIETFGAVESFLPDFSGKMVLVIRKSDGRAKFHALWTYEEMKHSIALETWLLASGHRTERQRQRFHDRLMEVGWELPYDTPRLMLVYQATQEQVTYLTYHQTFLYGMKDRGTDRQDPALERVLFYLKRDENAHYGFYFQRLKEWLYLDSEGTLNDLKIVFKTFKMPAQIIIPDIERRAKLISEENIYTFGDFVEKGRDFILDRLGVSRAYAIMGKPQYHKEYQAELARIEEEGQKKIITDVSPYLSQLAGFDADEINQLENLARSREKF